MTPASMVLADNCATLSDCFSNNLVPALLVILGLVALVALAWYAWPVLVRVAAGPVLRTVLGTAGRSRIAAALGRVASRFGGRAAARTATNQAQRAVQFTARQLQKKFKHAEDFGVTGNYNAASAQAFQRALQTHVRAPAPGSSRVGTAASRSRTTTTRTQGSM